MSARLWMLGNFYVKNILKKKIKKPWLRLCIPRLKYLVIPRTKNIGLKPMILWRQRYEETSYHDRFLHGWVPVIYGLTQSIKEFLHHSGTPIHKVKIKPLTILVTKSLLKPLFLDYHIWCLYHTPYRIHGAIPGTYI